MTVVLLHVRQQIQANGKFKITWIEIYQMVGSIRWYVIQQFLGKIAVGINQRDPMTKCNMLNKQVAEQCCFA